MDICCPEFGVLVQNISNQNNLTESRSQFLPISLFIKYKI